MELLLINLYTFLVGLARSAYTLLYNLLVRSLGYDNVTVGEANFYYSWGLAVGGLLFSSLSDRIGRKRTILVSVPVFALLGLARTFVTERSQILLISALFGFFDTSIVLPTISVIERSGEKQRLRNSNVNFAIVMLTGVLGYFGAGLLSETLGLRPALVLASGVAFSSALPVLFVREKVEKTKKRAEGLSLNATQLVMLVYYLVSGALVSFAAGVFVNFGNVIFYDLYRFSATLISLVLAFSQLSTAVSSLFSHKLTERFGYKSALFGLYLLVTVLIYSMPLMLNSSTLFTAAYVLRFVLLNLTVPMYTVFCLEQLPRGYMATFSGMSYFLSSVMRALASQRFSALSKGGSTDYPTLFATTGHFYLANTIATLGTFVVLYLVRKTPLANEVVVSLKVRSKRRKPGERGYLMKTRRPRQRLRKRSRR